MTESLVLVRWRDAHFHTDAPEREHLDYVVETVGWTTVGAEAPSLFLRLASERLPHGDGDRAVTFIPWGMVLDVVPLKVKKGAA